MSEAQKLNHQIDTWMKANPRKVGETGYYARVAAKFNIHPEKARKRWRMLNHKSNVKTPASTISLVGFNQRADAPTLGYTTSYTTGDGTVVTYETKEKVETIEDVIRVCKIDLTKYNVADYKIKAYTGWTKEVEGHAPVTEQLYSIQVSLKSKKIDSDPVMQKEFLISELKKASLPYKGSEVEVELSAYVSINPTERELKNHALEINIPDLHIGKLAWGKESGEDYDIDIAIERYTKAVKSLVSRVNPYILEKIILPVGNDLINVDNAGNTTTAGTHVSCDSRFGKMFQAAKKLLIDTIDFLSHICPVDVIIIPGNHDQIATFTLGEVIDAWYHNNDKVSVTNTHTPRKYVHYGQNLIMYTHGHREKLNDLPIICATEERQLWALTKYRRVHVGHYHHTKQVKFVDVQELPGMTVKILNSLSSNDAWHAEKGYLSLKGAEAFLYDKENGLVANYVYLNN